MGKSNFFWLIIIVTMLFLMMGSLISKMINPINVQNEDFECKANKCTLSFELYNDSNQPKTGVVTVHYRENSSFATAKAVSVFRTIKKPFEIGASGSQNYIDSFSSTKEGVKVYFAISTN